jgi:membrane fusion protein (multidrug efflux system)
LHLPSTVNRTTAVLIVAAGLWGCQKSPPAATGSAPVGGPVAALPTIKAEVLEIEPCRWPRLARGQGSLVADEVAIVGAKVPGRIADVRVDLGDVVKANAELVSLDREDLRLQIVQSEALLSQSRAAVGLAADASLETLNPLNSPPVREAQAVWDEARTKRHRLETLRQQNALTEIELQQVQAAEKVADAQYSSALNSVNEKIALIRVRTADLAVAKQRFADAITIAPFAGMVLQRHVAPGSYVQVGDPLVTLMRTSPLRYQGTLPERYAQEVRVGQDVQLKIDAAAGPRTVKVTRISPTLNPNSRALMFEADVDNADGRLRAGLFVEANIVLGPQQEAVIVPAAALFEFAGTEKVWKVVDGKATEQAVSTGDRRGELVEIISGLKSGDRILAQAEGGKAAKVEVVSTARVQPPAEPAVADADPTTLPVDSGAAQDRTGASSTCGSDE